MCNESGSCGGDMTPGYYVSQLKIYSRSVENDNPAQRGTNQMLKIAGGAMPVEVSGDSPQPKPIYQAGGDQPAVNPSSGIYPLDVSAAFSDDRKTLTFAVLNPSDSKHCMKLAVNGAKLASHGRL